MNQEAYLSRAKDIEKEFLSTKSIMLLKENGAYLVDGRQLTENEFRNWRNTLPDNIQLVIISSDDLITL